MDFFAAQKEAGFALVIFSAGAASATSFFMLFLGLVRASDLDFGCSAVLALCRSA